MSIYAIKYEEQKDKVAKLNSDISTRKAETARVALASLQKHIGDCTAWVRDEAAEFLSVLDQYPAPKTTKLAVVSTSTIKSIPKAVPRTHLMRKKNYDDDAISTTASTTTPEKLPNEDLLVFPSIDNYYYNMVTNAAAKATDLAAFKQWLERAHSRTVYDNTNHESKLEQLIEQANNATLLAKGAALDEKMIKKRVHEWRISPEGQKNEQDWAQWKKQKLEISMSKRLLQQLKTEIKKSLNSIWYDLEWERDYEQKELFKLEGMKLGEEAAAKAEQKFKDARAAKKTSPKKYPDSSIISTIDTEATKTAVPNFTKRCPFWVDWKDAKSRKAYYNWKSAELKWQKQQQRAVVAKK